MGKYVGKNALTAFWNGIKAMFSDVAFSGDYDDLDSKPSVETAASGGTTESLVTTGEKYDWNEKYEKPSGGIPASDLASAVQTSLGKADTALQSADIAGRCLWFSSQSIASTSGNSGTLCTISNSAITADHIIEKFVAANPAVITSGITCTTSAGQAVITGKSTATTTAEILLIKKDN